MYINAHNPYSPMTDPRPHHVDTVDRNDSSNHYTVIYQSKDEANVDARPGAPKHAAPAKVCSDPARCGRTLRHQLIV